jgi:hypothetical protein
MSTSLRTVFAGDSHLTEGKLLLEEPRANRGKSLIVRERTRMLTVSYKEGQNLHPV